VAKANDNFITAVICEQELQNYMKNVETKNI